VGLQAAHFLPLNYSAASDDCLFYDLIYGREPTPFLKPAIALGRRALDGAGMLANQGELAFELFNGVAPPTGLMRAALMAALGRR
jgi:shikimate dehydrogenase